MKPLHVVHLISADLWAGAEVATYHAVSALARRADLQVSVIALNEGEFCSRIRNAGIVLHVVPEGEYSFSELRREIKSLVAGCDIVHAHRNKENLLAALCGVPWVCTQHGRPEPFSGLAQVRATATGWLDRRAQARSARRTIAVSSEVEDWLLEFLDPRQIALVSNGIADPVSRGEVRSWDERPFQVGVLGRLAPVKRFELALAAVAGCPALQLEIVGDGPERAFLEDQARQLGISERVDFLGHLPDPLRRVESWRALLVTSLHEGNPISVLEAMALGTPVICGGLRGVEEAIAGGAGWVVDEPSDAAVWSRLIVAVLRNEGEGRRASLAARERFLTTFTSARCADQLASVYREVLTD